MNNLRNSIFRWEYANRIAAQVTQQTNPTRYDQTYSHSSSSAAWIFNLHLQCHAELHTMDHSDHFLDCNRNGGGTDSVSHSHHSRRPVRACNSALRSIASQRQWWLANGPSQAQEERDIKFPRTDCPCYFFTHCNVDFLGYWYKIQILNPFVVLLFFFSTFWDESWMELMNWGGFCLVRGCPDW